MPYIFKMCFDINKRKLNYKGEGFDDLIVSSFDLCKTVLDTVT